MAEVTKTTKQVQKVIYEDKDVINVTMSAEEATAVYSALWLMEMVNMSDPNYVAIKGVQDALGMALEFPATKLRCDSNHEYNGPCSIYLYPLD